MQIKTDSSKIIELNKLYQSIEIPKKQQTAIIIKSTSIEAKKGN